MTAAATEHLKRGTLKSFREYLNRKHPRESGLHRNYQFQQRTREYGDYLFNQDRQLFDTYLQEALDGDAHYSDWEKP